MLKKMKMEKKKLKFKFFVVCLMFVLSFGLVSFKTFAYSTNVQVGDKIVSVQINNASYNLGDDLLFIEFSNGYYLGYYSYDDVFVMANSDEWTDSENWVSEFPNDVFEFDEPVIIEQILNEEIGNFDLEFEFYEPTLLESIFDVFTNIGTYIMFLVSSLIVVFYAEGQLTILGILALCGLAISIILLIINIIQNFLHFRG